MKTSETNVHICTEEKLLQCHYFSTSQQNLDNAPRGECYGQRNLSFPLPAIKITNHRKLFP